MTRYKISSLDNLLLFSQSLVDRLPEDDEVYGFDALIDQIDVSAITRKYSTLGSKCFHPRTISRCCSTAIDGAFSVRASCSGPVAL
jgi:hypothetical protein